MKTFLFALLFLSASTSHLPSLATARTVFDVDGEPLRNGGLYYVVPYIWALGGGLDLAATGNETCPLTVVQNPSELSLGKPVRISSMLRIFTIRTGDHLEIAFDDLPECAPTPSKWTVVEGLPEGGWPVKITGYDKEVIGKFQIESVGPSLIPQYKLVFSPRDGIGSGDLLVNSDDNGIRRVIVKNWVPFSATDVELLTVAFKKAITPLPGSLSSVE